MPKPISEAKSSGDEEKSKPPSHSAATESNHQEYLSAREQLDKALAESPSIAPPLASREPPVKVARRSYFVWSDRISYYEIGEDGQLLLHASLVKPKDPGELKALLASLDQQKEPNPSTAPAENAEEPKASG